MTRKLIGMTLIGLLAAAPAAAQHANSATSLSVAKSVRASSPSSGTNKLAALGTNGLLIAAAGALAVGGGVYLATKDDDDDDSDSN